MPTYRLGLLPLSGDPITFGHLALMRMTAEVCDELLVALLVNPAKAGSYVLPPRERESLTKRAIAAFCPGIKTRVIRSDDSQIDVFLREGCDVLIRGVRNSADRAFEEQQIALNQIVYPDIRKCTVVLTTDHALAHVSSTAARMFAHYHADASSLVPLFVQARLWRHMHDQKVIAVIGEKGVGKTTCIQAAIAALGALDTPVHGHHLDLDALARSVVEADEPGARQLKSALTASPGDPKFRELFEANFARHYRAALTGKRGVVFVESSQVCSDLSRLRWVNNNVAVVTNATYGTPAGTSIVEACNDLVRRDHSGLVLDVPNNGPDDAAAFAQRVIEAMRHGDF